MLNSLFGPIGVIFEELFKEIGSITGKSSEDKTLMDEFDSFPGFRFEREGDSYIAVLSNLPSPLSHEDFSIEVNDKNRLLKLAIIQNSEKGESDGKTSCEESSVMRISYHTFVPGDADIEKMSAVLSNNVLTVTVPVVES